MLTKDELLSAVPEEIIGNPWVQNVIETLRGVGGEAVGECVKRTGSLKDMMIIRWRVGFTPHEGQLLYTAPAAPANEALAGRLQEIMSTVQNFGGWQGEVFREINAVLGGGE